MARETRLAHAKEPIWLTYLGKEIFTHASKIAGQGKPLQPLPKKIN
jgi:hypothetical protein